MHTSASICVNRPIASTFMRTSRVSTVALHSTRSGDSPACLLCTGAVKRTCTLAQPGSLFSKVAV